MQCTAPDYKRPLIQRKPMRKAPLTIAVLLSCCVASASHAAFCTADLNDDGGVGPADLAIVLGAWGPNPGHPADFNNDDSVDATDLAIVLGSWGKLCDTPVNTLELAGKELGEYPHFQYTVANNRGTTIQIAIDPTRFPGIIGQTCDVYVVQAKSEADWNGDGSLTDVRPGGAQSITFAGGNIQGNTFNLDETTTLASDGVLDVGVPYDLVCDCDEDGELSGGDYIDGLSDQAGFYILEGLTVGGPLAVTALNYAVGGVTPGFTFERLYYPTAIAAFGELPIVIISHGNGHNYTWYDYLGNHLASYGYIVMSHQNNTVPGIQSCSITTLEHTDAFLGQLAGIAGGALVGHVDGSLITWIGHSRGGEGVARAYDRILDGSYVPTFFSASDIKLISSIAPTDFLGTNQSNPADRTHHLLYGSADGDVCGCPSSDIPDSFNIYERATAQRQSTYIHGADHNDFNCCGFNDFDGPPGTEIGRTAAQNVTKVVYLALIEHHIDGNIPAKDILWRQYEDFLPVGIGAGITVVSEFRENPADVVIIDNYQSQSSSGTSSSGGAVTFNVSNIFESVMNDNNTSFSWTTADPMNGMTRGRTSDSMRGTVFNFTNVDTFYEQEIIAAERDLSDDAYLSFRACQGTRHPDTTPALEDLTFSVTLRDGGGITSTINFGAYGGGIEEPYQRTGFGGGAGWQNEFEVIRIRLTDFLTNGSGLDLSDVAAIRFEFGPSSGSSRGRIGLDDIVITKD